MTLSTVIILLIFILALLAVALYVIYDLLREQKTTNELLKNQPQQTVAQQPKDNSFASAVVPVKVQAYERLLLYMERLQPSVLVKRNFDASIPLQQFHLSLLQNIREEFEHNLVQQLYVSETVWNLIKASRETLIQQINTQVAELPSDADTTYLAQVLVGLQIPTIDEAIELLKAEFLILSH